MSSVRDRIRQLEWNSRNATPVKPVKMPAARLSDATPGSVTGSVAGTLYSCREAEDSPDQGIAPISEGENEIYEEAVSGEEDEVEIPGMNQRILSLKHPPPPLASLTLSDFN